MKTSALGILMFALVACADITPVKDFNLEKMAGKWYMVGFGSNAQWFVNRTAQMKMGTAVLTSTAEGDLNISYASPVANGTCWRMTHLALKSDSSGRFTFYSQAWKNDNDMRIVDVVYDDYAIVHTIKTRDGVSDVLNNLYSRTPVISDELQQKFTQFSLQTGILAENIIILPQNDECPEA